jgi:carboxylesterase
MNTNPSNRLVQPEAAPFLYPGNSIGCLLVHGFTGSPREMRLMGNYLRPQGWTILAPRLAGHGTSPKDLERCKWHDWLADVEDGVSMLRETCSKVFVAGLSMGAALSIIAAERYDVDGLIAISAPYSMPRDWRIKLIPVLKYLMPSVSKGPSDWDDEANAIGHSAYKGWTTAAIPELSKVIEVMHRSAPNVTVPALLIQAAHDSSIPLEHVQLHYNDLGSRDKEILIVEHSGHVVTRDTDREIAFEKTAQFIKRLI